MFDRCSFRIALTALALVAAGCAEKHGPEVGTNTNWLQQCVDSSTCSGGLSCICGFCSRACTDAAGCARLGDVAVCETREAESCDGTAREVCVAECTSNFDCANIPGGLCMDDICVMLRGDIDTTAPSDAAPSDGGVRMDWCGEPLDCTKVDCAPYAAPPTPLPLCSDFGLGVWEGICGKVRYRGVSTGFTSTIHYWNVDTGELLAIVNTSDTGQFCDDTSLEIVIGDIAAPSGCDVVIDDSTKACRD